MMNRENSSAACQLRLPRVYSKHQQPKRGSRGRLHIEASSRRHSRIKFGCLVVAVEGRDRKRAVCVRGL